MIYLQLALEFFKAGLFAVGGGLATLPFLYRMAAQYPWFTEAELLDMIAISESTPGPIGVNMATYAGFSTAGISGALVATGALITPSIIIIILIAKFLSAFSEKQVVKDAFYGLRPAVTALIGAAGFQVMKASLLHLEVYQHTKQVTDLVDSKAFLLFLLLLVLTNKLKKVHPVVFLAGAAVVGMVLSL